MDYFLKVFCFCVLILCRSGALIAQADTAMIMEEVTISSSKLIATSGIDAVTKVDSAAFVGAVDGSLTTLLRMQSGMHFRTYQQGGLATVSFRGATAAQTAVLWHGFNINNTMNGLSNLGNIPASLLHDIAIVTSGNSVHWGSGAIGGSIHLNTFTPTDSSHLDAQIAHGAYGSFGAAAKVGATFNKHSLQVKGQWQNAANTFPFTSVSGQQELMSHAQAQSRGWMIDDEVRITLRSRLSGHVWYQYNAVDIPATLLESRSVAHQTDEVWRSVLQWRAMLPKAALRVALANFDERQWYNDSNIGLAARHLLSSWYLDTEYKRIIPNGDMIVSANGANLSAHSSNYNGEHTQQRYNVVCAITQIFKRLTTRGSVRFDHISAVGNAYTFHLGSAYRIRDWLLVRGSVDKVFRAPTLNDLFWVPGGNRALKPEYGYAEQLGVQLLSKRGRFQWEHTSSFFNRNIYDWIQWSPSGSVWSPKNLLQVWSRGYETETKARLHTRSGIWRASLTTAYILSSNQKSNVINDNTVGKQLIYMPKFQTGASLSFEWKTWTWEISHHYVSDRYVTSDHSALLMPYQLVHSWLQYRIRKFKKLPEISLVFKLDNLLDTEYQTVINMPVAGRQWFWSVKFAL